MVTKYAEAYVEGFRIGEQLFIPRFKDVQGDELSRQWQHGEREHRYLKQFYHGPLVFLLPEAGYACFYTEIQFSNKKKPFHAVLCAIYAV
jgi:hypothetical protein